MLLVIFLRIFVDLVYWFLENNVLCSLCFIYLILSSCEGNVK